MRKIVIIPFVVMLTVLSLQAQETINFFGENGVINDNPELNEDLSYTLTRINSKAEDVVWAQVVYSIIDLRDKRNAQLAFPVDPDATYKNLFRVISEAIVNGAPVYYPNDYGIAPQFKSDNLVLREKLSDVFFIETDVAGAQYVDPLFDKDATTNGLKLSSRIYDRFSKSINRFMIQRVFYFDKNLSRFNSKIIAIAPLKVEDSGSGAGESEEEGEAQGPDIQLVKTALKESVLAWLLLDDLKVQFAKQPVYQIDNIAQRVSYFEFFTKRMFGDYLVGDNNLFRRIYSSTQEITTKQLKDEVNNIREKIVKIESEVWDY
jgi:hypothetical protein